MDVARGQREPRERSYPRIPSRASAVSAVNSHMTSHSANSSSSQLREPSSGGSHSTHKHRHSNCGSSAGGHQPISRVSSKPSDEFRKSTMSTSALLQERLQQARNEMQAAKQGSDSTSFIDDVQDRDTLNSPVKSGTPVGRRQMPDFSYEPPDAAGMGARQMEQTLSTLHKQNFDLKVEVFHRREKQVDLEARIDQLEERCAGMQSIIAELKSQRDERDDVIDKLEAERNSMNDRLVEFENAVVEAVRVIVQLEREKEMVRQVETDGAYRHLSSDEQPNSGSAAAAAGPNSANLSIPLLAGDGARLERVPSFLSERSQQTENLRNAVLKGRGSFMHLRKVSESSVSPSDINRVASPSLSMLSESSFASVYGLKGAQDDSGVQPSDGIVGMDGSHADRLPTQAVTNADPESIGGGAKLSATVQSLNHVLGINSPVKKSTPSEGRMVATDEVGRQAMPNRSRGIITPTPAKPSPNPPPQGKPKTKSEKREALQRVLTNYPTHRDFSNPQAFPPTPDTVSSSTLRKHQNLTDSQDSLARPPGIVPSEVLVPVHERIGAAREHSCQAPYSQQAPPRSFSGRRQIPMPMMDNNPSFPDLGQLARSLPPRPHSAAETTSSRARPNSVGSDSDSDGGADTRSEAPSVDYWMRESMRPDRYQTNPSAPHKTGRPASPDLFSFPADARGWETDVIFGALRGNGYLGSPVSALKRDPLDEMASSLRTPQTEMFDPSVAGQAPPTPDRRSSLHARTGSASAVPSSSAKFRKSFGKGPGVGWMDGKSRSNSIDAGAYAPPGKAYPQQQPEATTPGRRNHYPPISGQAPNRRSLGLNSFFRRSGPENHSVPASATEATFPTSNPNPNPNSNPGQITLSSLPPTLNLGGPLGRSSVPPPATMPWRPPGVVEDDFKSATPPPIMRSRGQSLVAGSGIGSVDLPHVVTSQNHGTDLDSCNSPTTAVPAPKRKWLGLGKMGGLKRG